MGEVQKEPNLDYVIYGRSLMLENRTSEGRKIEFLKSVLQNFGNKIQIIYWKPWIKLVLNFEIDKL